MNKQCGTVQFKVKSILHLFSHLFTSKWRGGSQTVKNLAAAAATHAVAAAASAAAAGGMVQIPSFIDNCCKSKGRRLLSSWR